MTILFGKLNFKASIYYGVWHGHTSLLIARFIVREDMKWSRKTLTMYSIPRKREPAGLKLWT